LSNYVDNETVYDAVLKYQESKKVARESGAKLPQIPEDIGKAIVLICEKMSTRWNFNGYTWREEMVGDGIITALKAIDKFDPEKSKNIFGYLSMIIFRCFVKRIQRENKQTERKVAMMLDNTLDCYSLNPNDVGSFYGINKTDITQFYMNGKDGYGGGSSGESKE
jgi:DNA-directed RNA polymerase specialized sigma subunit